MPLIELIGYDEKSLNPLNNRKTAYLFSFIFILGYAMDLWGFHSNLPVLLFDIGCMLLSVSIIITFYFKKIQIKQVFKHQIIALLANMLVSHFFHDLNSPDYAAVFLRNALTLGLLAPVYGIYCGKYHIFQIVFVFLFLYASALIRAYNQFLIDYAPYILFVTALYNIAIFYVFDTLEKMQLRQLELNNSLKSQISEAEYQKARIEELNQELLALNEQLEEKNETQFRQMFENHTSIMIIVSPGKGLIVNANHAALKFYGYSKEEFCGFTIYNLSANSDSDPKQLINIEKLEQSVFESKHRLANNEIRTVEIHSTPVSMENGMFLYFIIHDITDRKNAEAELLKSEKRYKELFDTLGEGVGYASPDEILVLANPAAEAIYEVDKGELIGKSLLDYLDENEKQRLLNQTSERKRGAVSKYELNIITKTKKRKTISVTATPRFDENHNYLGAFGIFEDVTHLKQNEQRLIFLNESVVQLLNCNDIESIYDYTANGILQFLHDTKILIFNVNKNSKTIRPRKIYGFSESEINALNRTLNFNILEKDFNITKIFDSSFADNKIVKFESLMQFFNGNIPFKNIENYLNKNNINHVYRIGILFEEEPIACIDLFTPYVLDNSTCYFIETFIRQSTTAIRRKIFDQQLIIAKEEAEAGNKAKSSFLANMSHEIRTPLNAVLGFSEILTKRLDNTDLKNYAKSIYTNGRALLELLNDILDLAKLESQKLFIQNLPIQVKIFLDEISYLYKPLAEKKGLQWIVEKTDDFPAIIKLDETRLKQVLTKIISNGIKFTSFGFIKISLSHKIINSDTCIIKIAIQDSGIGIDSGVQHQIFLPFVQKDTNSNRKYEGTGLGLAISKRLIELMDGKITLVSQPGAGSTFTIEFMDVKYENKTDGSDKISDPDTEEIEFEKSVVLIVDDDEVNRDIIKKNFSHSEIRFLEAESGEQCVQLATENKVDLILMDLNLHGISGYETTEILRRNDLLRQIPIIAVSGTEINTKILNENINFNSQIIKPVSYTKLVSEFSRFLKHKVSQKTEKKIFDIELSGDFLLKLPELIDILNDNFLPKWNKINQKISLNEIKEFAGELIEVGTKYNFELLVKYAGDLQKYAKSFGISLMKETFARFPLLIDELSKLKQNNNN